MYIRKAKEKDLRRIMEIYAYARSYMAAHGNYRQWGPNCWPPESLIREDILHGKSYVCEDQGRIIGVFYFDAGKDIEPTYRVIENGEWQDDSSYGVVHRLAGDGSVKGIGSFCLDWAFAQCGHLRVDTHTDNHTMQGLVSKLGFAKCGIIHVEEDNDPRYAYEKVQSRAEACGTDVQAFYPC